MKKILFVCVENAGRSQMAELCNKSEGKMLRKCRDKTGTNVNPLVVEAMREA